MSQPDTLFTNDWHTILTKSNKNSKALLCPKVLELYPKHDVRSYGMSLILKDKTANMASAPSTTLMFGDGEKYSSATQQGLNWWKQSLERHSLQASDLIHLNRMNINHLDGSIDSKNYHEMKQSEPLSEILETQLHEFSSKIILEQCNNTPAHIDFIEENFEEYVKYTTANTNNTPLHQHSGSRIYADSRAYGWWPFPNFYETMGSYIRPG